MKPKQITECTDEKQLCDFYKELADKQEPLGEEFEKVLNENIEELYFYSEDEKPIAALNGEEYE